MHLHVQYLEYLMIKTILWDFDGVILDSMKIKGNGFVELFNGYDKVFLDEIEKYHYANGGISRFNKIRYFYNKILKQDISEKKILELAEVFAKIIEKEINNKDNLIQDSVTFLKENYKKYNFHIVSGAEEKELQYLCRELCLNDFFISINGSPIEKDILVKNILKKYKYQTQEIILIGDSINDFNAAQKNEISFYGYNNIELKVHGNYIKSFSNIKNNLL